MLICYVLRAGIPASAQKVLYLFSTQAVYPDHSPTRQCPILVQKTVYSCKYFSISKGQEKGDSSESIFTFFQSDLKITMRQRVPETVRRHKKATRENWGQGGGQRLADDGSQSRTQGQVKYEKGKCMDRLIQ